MAYEWSRQPLATSPWRSTIVPHIPAILIKRAKEGRTITYGELADELHKHYGHEPVARKTLYGPAVGAVGFALAEIGEEWGEKIPPLNLIVVQASTGLPGRGADEVAHYYFDDGGAGMSKNRQAYIEAAIQAVFDYGKAWDRVAEALGASSLKTGLEVDDKGDPIPLPKPQRGSQPESAEHKAIKEWVRSKPALFTGYGNFKVGDIEHYLSSGDRLDVFFSHGKDYLAVECKPGHCSDQELMRGIYQCIKYRAVLRAERIALRKPPAGNAILASTRKPSKQARALMRRLRIDFMLLPEEAER